MADTEVVDISAPIRERRRYSRTPILSYANLTVEQKNRRVTIPGKICDVSPAGICFELGTQHILKPGDNATVTWTIPPQVGFTLNPKQYKLTGTIVRLTTDGVPLYTLGIKLTRLIPEQIEWRNSRPLRSGAVFVALLIALGISFLRYFNLKWFWWTPIANTYSLIAGLYILSRVITSLFYREPADHGHLPSVSMIICAKNEEVHIAETVEHAFASRYPTDLMEVIVIDDGSSDRTWERLSELSAKHPRLHTIHHEKNLGKRFAMATGVKNAKHEIIVFVDSDSLVEPEGLYRLVQPFADKAVGAVAGEIAVQVEPDNFISKMEVVRYQISQSVIKASESVFNAVTCCSGPFSAYRRLSVERVMPAWLTQTFAGERATFGDDRSLTNYILRTHRAVFHQGAVCRTYVPKTWRMYFHQQLRWKKSWAREAIIACQFMWRKNPFAALLFYTGIGVTLFSPLIALRAMLYLPVVLSVSCLPYLLGLTLTNMLLACVFFYYTRMRYWPYLFAFVVLYVTALCWQTYYAMITIPRTHWGTRD